MGAKLKFTTFEQLYEKLSKQDKHLYGNYCFIGHNTEAILITGDYPTCIKIKYHGNTIALLYPDTTIIYNAGWYTSTTKDRINQLLPEDYRVYQENFVWYLYVSGNKLCEFKNGMMFVCGRDGWELSR